MLENYKLIQTINDEHKIYLVKNILDDSIYVKKELSIYDLDIYNYLLEHRFKGIPYIKELIEIDGKLIVIEEYISGTSIETMLDNNKIFSENEVKEIVLQLCSILKKLNKHKDFVHRDIKPSNLILKDSELFLIDFNAAKFSTSKNRDTVLLGTEGYAAPEQYGFGESNMQSDIYAIGVLMKEMLTGTNNLNSNYKSSLKPVINKCTKLDPESRYQDYTELIRAIKYKRVNINKYLPVGFRHKNGWVMLLASIWYFFIFMIGITINFDGDPLPPLQLFISRVGFAGALIIMTLFAGNYLGCQKLFKINPKWNILIRIVLVTVIDVILGVFFLSTVLIFASAI